MDITNQNKVSNSAAESQGYPIYKKSSSGYTFYKVIDSSTVITLSHGQISTNHFSRFTIIDLLGNISGVYPDSSEAEWNEQLEKCEKGETV